MSHMTLRISYEEREGIGKESFSEIGNQYSENNSEQYRKVHKRIRLKYNNFGTA